MAIQTLIAGLLASVLVLALSAIANVVGHTSAACDVQVVSSSTPPDSQRCDCACAANGRPRG